MIASSVWGRLSIPLLVLGGLLVTTPSRVEAQTDADNNHFKCYATVGAEPADPKAILGDQFDPAGAGGDEVKVFKTVRFCNPVEKTTEDGAFTPIVDPQLHLSLFRIATQSLAPTRRVVVRNQFGRQRLLVFQPVLLAVPTEKNNEGVSNNRDHYKCYSAYGGARRRSVLLRDQFTEGPAEVRRPRLFCNPVEKRHGDLFFPIERPDNHLVCYQIRTENFTTAVVADNQFLREELLLAGSDLLCVPSEKLKFKAVE